MLRKDVLQQLVWQYDKKRQQSVFTRLSVDSVCMQMLKRFLITNKILLRNNAEPIYFAEFMQYVKKHYRGDVRRLFTKASLQYPSPEAALFKKFIEGGQESTPTHDNFFDRLPDDILFDILSNYADPKSLANLSATCERFNRELRRIDYWRNTFIAQGHDPAKLNKIENDQKISDYKNLYFTHRRETVISMYKTPLEEICFNSGEPRSIHAAMFTTRSSKKPVLPFIAVAASGNVAGIHYFIQQYKIYYKSSILKFLQLVAESGSVPAIRFVIDVLKMKPELHDYELLGCAIESGVIAAVKYLLSYLNINLAELPLDKHEDILRGSVKSNNPAMVRFILATTQIDPNLEFEDGGTMLHYAALMGNVSMLRYLVEECHLDPHHLRHRDMDALQLSLLSGNPKAVTYLRSVGLDPGRRDAHERNANWHLVFFRHWTNLPPQPLLEPLEAALSEPVEFKPR